MAIVQALVERENICRLWVLNRGAPNFCVRGTSAVTVGATPLKPSQCWNKLNIQQPFYLNTQDSLLLLSSRLITRTTDVQRSRPTHCPPFPVHIHTCTQSVRLNHSKGVCAWTNHFCIPIHSSKSFAAKLAINIHPA